jgi:hypothetical protein
VPAVSPGAVQQALARPDELPRLQLVGHPSLTVLRSAWAVVSLWAANQTEGEPATVAVDAAEQALVLREGLDVHVLPVDAGTAAFASATQQGRDFGDAAALALAAEPTFDLAAALGLLLHRDALVALRAPSSTANDTR